MVKNDLESHISYFLVNIKWKPVKPLKKNKIESKIKSNIDIKKELWKKNILNNKDIKSDNKIIKTVNADFWEDLQEISIFESILYSCLLFILFLILSWLILKKRGVI
jgi:ATP-dependent Zn protease